MANFLSPGVFVQERDASTTVPAGAASSGAFVGPFRWGPVEQPTLITDETALRNVFGTPVTENNTFWFSAFSFLAYTDSLWLARAAATTVLNAVASGTAIQIKNDDDWTDNYSAGEAAVGEFAARYPGAIGNSLRVSVADSGGFTGWTYEDLFDSAPATSAWVEDRGGANDEMHIVVVDELGLISGTPGTILETYAYASKASDAKYADGSTAYYKNVLANQSAYIHWMDHVDATGTGSDSTTTFGDIGGVSPAPLDVTLSGGVDDFATTDDGEYQTAWSYFDNPETIDIALIFMGPHSVATTQYVIDNIAEVRRDLVVCMSPAALSDVRGSGIVTKVVDSKNNVTTGVNRSTSYGFFTSNWKMIFDRYNEVNVWIPDNADIAGLMAQTDVDRDPWWSPAGFERGRLKNVVRLAWNPNKSERDQLYKSGINPVLNFPGQGPVLYGDKTMLNRSSAFDRINVRRLFIYIEKAIAEFSKSILFDFNDEFTRAQFVNAVTPFLRNVQGRRGISSFQVVADETVNTPTVIDRNEFIANILVAPARSINFVNLIFTATRSGVNFDELV